jgi:diphthamide synthase subunit DPH2
MQQFKNAAGLIEISRLSFSENEVTELAVCVLLGTKGSQMNPDEISKMVDWYKQLKVQASNYCKD